MTERISFAVLDSTRVTYRDSISLSIEEKFESPFTGNRMFDAKTESGEQVLVKSVVYNIQAEHEWKGLRIAHSTGIPVPDPIALICCPENRLAIVSTKINGRNLYEFPNQEVKNELGGQIRIMHDLAIIDGGHWRSSGRSNFIYYDKYMFEWDKSSIAELCHNSTSATLLRSLSVVSEQFCKTVTPVFNHNDLHDGQVLVEDNGRPVIVDFGNWIEESWLNEIGYHLFHLIRINRIQNDEFLNFLNGYLGGKKLSEQEMITLNFYLIFISSRALNHFYRRNDSYLPIAKQTHNNVLNHIDQEMLWKL